MLVWGVGLFIVVYFVYCVNALQRQVFISPPLCLIFNIYFYLPFFPQFGWFVEVVFLVEANIELYYCVNIVIYIFRTLSFIWKVLKNFFSFFIAKVEHIHILYCLMAFTSRPCIPAHTRKWKWYTNLTRWLVKCLAEILNDISCRGKKKRKRKNSNPEFCYDSYIIL